MSLSSSRYLNHSTLNRFKTQAQFSTCSQLPRPYEEGFSGNCERSEAIKVASPIIRLSNGYRGYMTSAVDAAREMVS
jgi:hypothetical protein